MIKYNRTIIVAIIIFLSTACLFSFDFGGTLSNQTGYISDIDTPFTQTDNIALWLSANPGKNVSFYTEASGIFSITSPYYIFNLNQLNLTCNIPFEETEPSLFGFKIGRFTFEEFTKKVLSHTADGFKLQFNYPAVSITSAFGYTGLILKPVSTISLSKTDISDDNNTDFFGSPRILGLLEISLPEVFGRQNLKISAVVQEDLRILLDRQSLIEEGEEEFLPAKGGKFDSQYFGIGLSGPVAALLYYDAFFYLGTGSELSYIDGSYQFAPILSYLTGGSLRYYMKNLLYSKAEVNITFASGDNDRNSYFEGNTLGNSSAFMPVSPSVTGFIFSPGFSNIIIPDISWSIKPFINTGINILKNIQTVAEVKTFLKPYTGVISEAGIITGSEDVYIGSEIDLLVNYRIYSDLGFSLLIGCFLPNSDIFLDGKTIQFGGELSFSFSF